MRYLLRFTQKIRAATAIIGVCLQPARNTEEKVFTKANSELRSALHDFIDSFP